SSVRVHNCSPVAASMPYAFARASPKYAAYPPDAPDPLDPAAPLGPITIPVRTPAFAWNVQTMQPLFASMAYTVPLWLPTKPRPPARVGAARAVTAFGNPTAHLSVSFGVCSADTPASAAG